MKSASLFLVAVVVIGGLLVVGGAFYVVNEAQQVVLTQFGKETLVELVMGEGRKREVRRMFDAIGFPVVALVRTAIGPLADRDLSPGTWRALTIDEIRSLYAAGDP